MTLLLRAIAIVVAGAALVDPSCSLQRATAARFITIRLASTDVAGIERRLATMFPDVAWTSRGVRDGRLPCSPGERCVVITDGSIAARVPQDLTDPVSIVEIRPGPPNVALTSLTSSAAHAEAASLLTIGVSAAGLDDARVSVRVYDGDLLVGRTDHPITNSPDQQIAVPWVPVETGVRLLRVELAPLQGESTRADNIASAAVDVRREKIPVLVFDARPSWGSTFARRAIEDDPRFRVQYRARLAPSLTAGTARARLDPVTLDAADVLIVGAPEALTAAEVEAIETFVRRRGGTAILLPEQSPSGRTQRLFAGRWSELLLAAPRIVNGLRAGELLRASDLPPPATTIGRDGDVPVIVSTPTGEGRVIVVGLMDAWRYRDGAADVFDRFWQTVASESAEGARPLMVRFDAATARPGSRQRITVRFRSMDPPAALDASAVMKCGSSPPHTIRLWPAGQGATFTGEGPVADSAVCEVEARVNDAHATAGFAVARSPAPILADVFRAFHELARRSGGVVTNADKLEALRPDVHAMARPALRETVAYPMRSAWWILPFSLCLAAEWFLRRRNGLR